MPSHYDFISGTASEEKSMMLKWSVKPKKNKQRSSSKAPDWFRKLNWNKVICIGLLPDSELG
jgi:hypothetical protein